MLDALNAYKAQVESQNPTAPIRMMLTDTEAVELVGETPEQFLAEAVPVSEALAGVLAVPIPTESDAIQAWAEMKGAASRALWDQISGTTVNGVEILRKRA